MNGSSAGGLRESVLTTPATKPPLAPLQPSSSARARGGPAAATASTSISSRREAPALSKEAIERWGAALGNMEELGLVVDGLARTLGEAVYLDDDAYDMQHQLKQYKEALAKRGTRNASLEAERELTLRELTESRTRQRALQVELQATEAVNATLRQEQENNAVVFRMHFNELLAKSEELEKKDEELRRLRGIIEVLQAGGKS